MCRAVHKQTVKVERCWLIPKLIRRADDNIVANICDDGRQWPLAIDTNGTPVECAIWICSDPSDVKVIGDCGSSGET